MTLEAILSILAPLLENLVPPIAAAITSFIGSFYSAKDPIRLADLVKQTVYSMAELTAPGADKRSQALADIGGAIKADLTYVEGIAADEVNFVVNSLLEKYALQAYKDKKTAP